MAASEFNTGGKCRDGLGLHPSGIEILLVVSCGRKNEITTGLMDHLACMHLNSCVGVCAEVAPCDCKSDLLLLLRDCLASWGYNSDKHYFGTLVVLMPILVHVVYNTKQK